MLRAECDANGVEWQMPCNVDATERTGDRFVVKTDKGEFRSASLAIATGGLSVPKLGASPFGYEVAEQFGLAIVAPRPGLVPLAFDAQELARYGDLSGVSLDAVVTCSGGRFRENLLFTHRGLSGPAILQISSYWTPGAPDPYRPASGALGGDKTVRTSAQPHAAGKSTFRATAAPLRPAVVRGDGRNATHRPDERQGAS